MAKQNELAEIQVVVVNGVVVETENTVFADNLERLESARVDGMLAGWKACEAMYNIVNGKLFQEKFKTKENFAESLGFSKSVPTKMVKAWEFKNSHEDLKKLTAVGYEKVYNLSNIPKEDYESVKNFCILKTGKCIWELGDNAFRKVYSEYKESKNIDSKEQDSKEQDSKKPEELREVKFIAPDGSTLIASISNKDIDTICKILRKGEHTIYDVDGNKIYPQEATPIKK